jgi:hypothetical protein
VVLWIANFVVAAHLLRRKVGGPPLTWAVRAGAVISLFGAAVAFMMTRPTAAQRASFSDGTFAGIIGAHSVGVADGGPIMPVTGWSTTGGDLRIAHFVGLHALQALPLVAVLLVLLAGRVAVLRAEAVRTRLVAVASAGYGGLTLLTLWQALRGQPLTQPGRGHDRGLRRPGGARCRRGGDRARHEPPRSTDSGLTRSGVDRVGPVAARGVAGGALERPGEGELGVVAHAASDLPQ